jgi:hypothetical protein
MILNAKQMKRHKVHENGDQKQNKKDKTAGIFAAAFIRALISPFLSAVWLVNQWMIHENRFPGDLRWSASKQRANPPNDGDVMPHRNRGKEPFH